MNKCFRFLALLSVCMFVLLGNVVPQHRPVQAQDEFPEPTIIVNVLVDDPSGCPERCTLRSAIATANPGDVIGFEPGLSGTLSLAQTLVIDKDLNIVGPGAHVVALDGSQKFLVLEIKNASVNISGLAIQNGGGDVGKRGGIYIESHIAAPKDIALANLDISQNTLAITSRNSKLIIDDSIINNNSDGGIYNQSTLEIYNSTFSGNSKAGRGAAIETSSGLLAISNSTFTDNSAHGYVGGAIYNVNGLATVIDSTFSRNAADQGGAIYNAKAPLTVINSIFTGNSATDRGGGIWNKGDATITDSTFSGNSAGWRGGAIDSDSVNPLTVTSSTFSDNSSKGDGGAIGIHGESEIINSTFYGNFAAGNGGGIYTGPGARAPIINSTLSGNSAEGSGGGIYAVLNLDLYNSIVAGNRAGGTGPDVYGHISSFDISLIGNVQGTDGSLEKILQVYPLLGPLADNGGRTQTMAVLPGSPAIDAFPGPCEWYRFSASSLIQLVVDQRGAPRTGPCDFGAYEFGSEPPN